MGEEIGSGVAMLFKRRENRPAGKRKQRGIWENWGFNQLTLRFPQKASSGFGSIVTTFDISVCATMLASALHLRFR